MNVEERIAFIKDLIAQIEHSWGTDAFRAEVREFAIRKYECIAKALELRPDHSRKEYFGVVFRLTWVDPSEKSFADVDVRINPDGSMSQTGDRRTHGPYYAVYVPGKGMKGLVTWKEFSENLDRTMSLTDFFRGILADACSDAKCAKIFGAKQTLSG